MEIMHHGFGFNTDTMAAFSTGAPSIPTIYINPDGLAFLEQSRNSWVSPRLRYLGRMEARRLAIYYGLNGILEILNRKLESSRVDLSQSVEATCETEPQMPDRQLTSANPDSL